MNKVFSNADEAIKDIKDGQILIDADTGRRLSDELADSQAEQNLNAQVGSTDDTMETIVIVLGVCLGLLLFVLFYYVAHIVVTKNEIPPTVESV